MTLDERLMTILAGSPAPLPNCQGGVWAGTALQRTPYGYVVFMEVTGAPIYTHDLQVEPSSDRTRQRVYQFECRHTTRKLARQMAASLVEILTRYRDSGPGIQRCVPKSQGREGWEEVDRVYRFDVDFDIMENFSEA